MRLSMGGVVHVFYEDIVVGYWTTTKYSGAFPVAEINQMLERIEKLRTAVKFAREQANMTEATIQNAGSAIASYLLDSVYNPR